jgi:hypothetical protein
MGNCDLCSMDVRKDELFAHKFNHEKLKTFGRKVKKPKLEKPVTGYGLWQKEERKNIVEKNPGMIFTEVSSELGRLWKLVSKENKEELKRMAKIHNDRLKRNIEVDLIEENDQIGSEEQVGPTEHLERFGVEDHVIIPIENPIGSTTVPEDFRVY